MTPPNAMQLVKELHAAYVARTGYELAYNMARENGWREWCAFGEWKWTVSDLSRVIGYLKAKIRKGERNEGALKFANLIGRPDNFEEDLNLARAEAKKVFGGTPRSPRPAAAETAPEEAPLDAAEAARIWREQFGRS
jgi:hypothetical protein